MHPEHKESCLCIASAVQHTMLHLKLATPPIHTREKGGKAVQCTRALMNVKHFEEETRRSRPNAQIVFLTCRSKSILVMAMLVLQPGRCVRHIRPSSAHCMPLITSPRTRLIKIPDNIPRPADPCVLGMHTQEPALIPAVSRHS